MVIEETKETKKEKPYMSDEELLSFLRQCKDSGIEYRNRFKPTWDECEQQLRCVPPASWDAKDDWQSKIYIPMQAKKSEIAISYLNKMIFGKNKNFDVDGVEEKDKEVSQYVTTIIETLMRDGNYYFENKFVLPEATDLGTGFIKWVMRPDRKGLSFTWRSIYDCVFDPQSTHDFDRKRFWIDMYQKDISWIISEGRKEKGLYSKDAIRTFLKDAEEQCNSSQVTPASSEIKESYAVVKGIDGTNDIKIPAKYKSCTFDEYWVDVPSKDGFQKRTITVLNDKYILRNEKNEFGYIPAHWCRVKTRKYDSYGKGYVENTRGLQELMNSCVNLGFDSLKISAMDIIVIDDQKVADSRSIKYKPLAIWKMKDINAVRIQRTPMSAIGEVLKGVTLIDQIDQDASGVTRQAQGAPSLSGGGSGGETLGEYQLKLQAIDQRFLDVGRFIEEDYIVPVIKKIFNFIKNPNLFTQADADRILGMREVADPVVENGEVNTNATKLISKMDIRQIQNDEFNLDFKAIAMTQFAGKLEMLAKLKEALTAALENPTLTALTKIDLLWKKLWQESEIDGYEDFIRTKDEVAQLMGGDQSNQQMIPRQV